MSQKRHRNIAFNKSYEFWQKSYKTGGGTSGAGSRGRVARYKADFLNHFVAGYDLESVTDFGCGDSQQNALFDFPSYIGLDVAEEAIKKNKEKHKDRENMSFFVIDGMFADFDIEKVRADLTISLDVVFHLIEDEVFDMYMRMLFDSGRRFVAIFSHDIDPEKIDSSRSPHVRFRLIQRWVNENRPEFRFIMKTFDPNIRRIDDETRTDCSFFVFERKKP